MLLYVLCFLQDFGRPHLVEASKKLILHNRQREEKELWSQTQLFVAWDL